MLESLTARTGESHALDLDFMSRVGCRTARLVAPTHVQREKNMVAN